MKQKLLFFVVSMMMSVAAMAQWTKPVPKASDIVYGDTVFLYNVGTSSFFLGANSYGTRASVDPGHGYKCVLAETEGYVTISDYVENKGGMYFVFAEAIDGIWVDYNNQGITFTYFRFVRQDDGSYLIYNAASGQNEYPLGVDLTRDNKTELFLNDTEAAPEEVSNNWYIVLQADYNAYMEEYEVYATAQNLAAKIEEAKGFDINTTSAEAVYANTNSTIGQLQAAIDELQAAINDYKEHQATPDNPQDLTPTYIPDADFESNSGAGVWLRTHSAQNYQTSGTPNKLGDSTYFLEAWHGSPFTGKMYVPITGLPNGVYQFTLSVATNGGNGCYVYAGTDSIECTSGNMTPYTVFTTVEDGNLEVGLNMPKAIQNWVGIDDAKLIYLGNVVESYAYWVKYMMEAAPVFSEENVNATALAEYNAILETDPSSFATKEEVMAFYAEYLSALQKIKANKEAYERYEELYDEAQGLIDLGYDGQEADEMGDYLMETGEDIIENKPLSTEQVEEEIVKLQQMIEAVKTNCLAPGLDCTGLLVNPNFNSRLDGWTWDESLGTPAWGGLSTNPCVERWNENFNFYQKVVGLPNGVYELKVQAFYRPGSSTTEAYTNYQTDPTMEEILTFIYLNASEAPVTNIGAFAYTSDLEDDCVSVADGLYVPNGMNSASNAFSQGDYDNSVKGVVTDGTMTVGIKCTEGTISGRWPLWDNFRLTYIGMDYDAIKEVIDSYDDEIATLLDELMGNDAKEALEQANETAQEVEEGDGEAAFKALSDLIDAINGAKDSKDAYEQLFNANEEMLFTIEDYPDSPAREEAEELYNTVNDNYSSGTYTTEEALAKIEDIRRISAKLRIPDYSDASPENPVDFTQVIVNNSFEMGDLTGWTAANGDDTGVKENANATYTVSNADGAYLFNTWKNVASYDYNVTQTIYGLPAGSYKLTALLASDQNNKVTLSANDVSEEFTMENAKEIGQDESVYITLEEGRELVITASATNWFKCDNFRLEYYGGASQSKPGDVNEDGKVDINDVVAIINVMAGTADWKNANVNGDEEGKIDINDVVAVINIMAGN